MKSKKGHQSLGKELSLYLRGTILHGINWDMASKNEIYLYIKQDRAGTFIRREVWTAAVNLCGNSVASRGEMVKKRAIGQALFPAQGKLGNKHLNQRGVAPACLTKESHNFPGVQTSRDWVIREGVPHVPFFVLHTLSWLTQGEFRVVLLSTILWFLLMTMLIWVLWRRE